MPKKTQRINLTDLEFSGTYKAEELGGHNLIFTLTDSNGNIKESEVELNVSNASHEFVATGSLSNVLLGKISNINFIISPNT